MSVILAGRSKLFLFTLDTEKSFFVVHAIKSSGSFKILSSGEYQILAGIVLYDK